KFVTAVNNQSNYNKDGIVRAIPIIVYHTLVNYPNLSDITIALIATVAAVATMITNITINAFAQTEPDPE
ncbi:MAG: hypothetical protein ACJ71M_08120, partial [Nitrososphaeraceae archaeon]